MNDKRRMDDDPETMRRTALAVVDRRNHPNNPNRGPKTPRAECDHDFEDDPQCLECGMHVSLHEQMLLAEIESLTTKYAQAKMDLALLRKALQTANEVDRLITKGSI